jgi:hypothetical protein
LDDEVASKWDNGREDPAVILVAPVRDDGPRRQATRELAQTFDRVVGDQVGRITSTSPW